MMSEKIVGMRAPPGFAATAASAKDAELRALKNQLEQAEKQVTARTSQLEQAENQITAVIYCTVTGGKPAPTSA